MLVRKRWLVAVILLLLLLVLATAALLFRQEEERTGMFKNGAEIEKKWLIDQADIPYDLSSAQRFEIEQSYVCFDPEIRIRKVTQVGVFEHYVLTVKSNMSTDGLIRDEVEYLISQESYLLLLGKKEGATIHKVRYQIEEQGFTRSIDIFKGDLDGLAYMETEYETAQAAGEDKTPDWVLRDVTDDKRFKNQSLAQHGMPEDIR